MTGDMELAKGLKVEGEFIVGSNDNVSTVNVSTQLGVELSGLDMSFNAGRENIFNAGRSSHGRSYITIPAKTGLNTQIVHVDGSLLINSTAPIMFNCPAHYVVPSTTGQLDAIRIGVSGQPNGLISELLAEA